MVQSCCFLVLVLVSGCASKQRSQGIIVDTKGVDMQQYRQDLGECREYAKQLNTSAKVAKGAIGGAVVAGAVGAVVGNSDAAKRGAGAGAIAGAAKGYSRGEAEKRQVVKNCLRGRGYRVLNLVSGTAIKPEFQIYRDLFELSENAPVLKYKIFHGVLLSLT